MELRIFTSLSKNILGDVKNTLRDLAEKLTHDEVVQKWINSVFRNWLINDGPATKVVELAPEAPEWAKKAMSQNDLFDIDWKAATDQLRELVDYLHYLNTQGTSFTSMSVPEAIRQNEEWHAQLAGRKAQEALLNEEGIETVLKLEGGYSWVSVHGADALDREGNEMGHCVGSYFDQVSRGLNTIYSLRDAKNDPHITIEVRGNDVDQIKGKANKEVIAKYRGTIIPFLLHLKPDSIHVDESGLTVAAVRKAFVEAGLSKESDTPDHVEVKLSFGTVSLAVSKGGENEDKRWPRIVDEGSNWYHHEETLSLEYKGEAFKFRGRAWGPQQLTKQAIERAFGVTLTPDDVLTLWAHPLIQGSRPLRHCLEHWNKYVVSAAVRVTDREGSIKLAEVTDERVYTATGIRFQSLVLDSINRPICGVGDAGDTFNLTISKKPQAELSADDLTCFLALCKRLKLKTNHLSKSMQLRMLKAGTPKPRAGSKRATRLGDPVTYKRHLTPALKSALTVFCSSIDPKLIAKLDAGDVKQVLRASGLATSGYLYGYFKAFIHVLLMTDKDKMCKYLLSNVSMMRQITAFTAGLPSIQAGSWYRGFMRRNKNPKVDKAWEVISHNMKNLLCPTPFEIEQLLALRGTPKFKATIKSWLD